MPSRPNMGTYISEEEEYYGRGLPSRTRMPVGTRPGASAPVREIPNVAFDLDTNVNQFRNLFFEHINEGKIGKLGVRHQYQNRKPSMRYDETHNRESTLSDITPSSAAAASAAG